MVSDTFDHALDAFESGYYGQDEPSHRTRTPYISRDEWVKKNHPENYEAYKRNQAKRRLK